MAYRNPKTNRPIKFGTRVYNKLLQEGYTEEQLRENQPAHLQINNDVLPHHYIVNDNFNGYGLEYIKHLRLVIDPQMLLHDENNEIRNVIRNYIIEHDVIKFNIILNVTFTKPENQNKLTLHINSEYKILNRGDNINDFINDSAAEIVNKIYEKELEGSRFIIENINFIKIKLFEHIPAYAASSYFPTPNYLCSKSVINVQNTDNKCFMWAILSALHPAPNNPHRVSNYKPYENELNFENITFPVRDIDFPIFERNNPTIGINVYGHKYCYEDGTFPSHYFTIYYTNYPDREKIIDIMLCESDGKYHYIWLKKFDNILARKVHNNHNNSQYYFCRRCLLGMCSKEKIENHQQNCTNLSIYKMPSNPDFKFKNYYKMQAQPFWITLDFEAFNIPVNNQETFELKTKQIFHQEGNSFAYCVVQASHYNTLFDGLDDKMIYSCELSQPVRLYRGPDMDKKLFEYLDEDIRNILFKIENPVPYELSDIVEYYRKNATYCYLCNLGFDVEESKVVDHCHITGKVRGICHNKCNLQLRFNKKTQIDIPIIVHNLKNYDSHIIFKSLEKKYKINIIAQTDEKYISFNLNNMRFIDSYQFVNKPLAELVKEMKNDNHDNEFLKKTFPLTSTHFNSEYLDLVTEKGVYPYEYVNNFEQFNIQLPVKKEFDRNTLNLDEPISQTDYDFAQKVYEKFNCKNFGEYHDIYLYTDVLLLADYWANFCKNNLETYRLDPSHYYTTPGLSFDALLLQTNANLKLIQDREIFEFVESGLRGGISGVGGLRYAKANNPECPDYNPDEPNTWINYFDATALYSWAMMQYLPTGGHKIIYRSDQSERSLEYLIDKVINLPNNSSKGLLVKCDISIPTELHEYFKDYPPCPEQRIVNIEELSEYQQKLLTDNNIKLGKTQKLMLTLYDKKDYVIHYRLLKKFVSLGIIITKISQVVSFDQSPWMQPYIEKNNDLRKQAQIEKKKTIVELAKLMNNSVFGKTMENVKNRSDIEICQPKYDDKRIKQLTSERIFSDLKRFNDNLIAIHKKKYKVDLNKPIFVGQAILDISKELMYDFYYGLKNKYNENMRLIYTDTDSLILKFQTPNIYQDLLNMKDKFDNTDMKQDYLRDSTNMKVPGKFKDETSGVPIYEVVALKSKMYSYKLSNNKEDRRAKGVKKANVKRDLSHELYKDCLFNSRMDLTVKQYNIESKNHNLGVYEHIKTSLTAFDSKKVNYNILECRPIGFIN